MTWLCIFVCAWHSLHVFPRLALITCFSAIGTGYMFSRAFHRLHVFPRLSLITFSRNWHWLHVFRARHRLHVFPLLSLVTCFPPFVIGFMFSRAWHRLHVFPRLALAKCFPALGIGCVFWRYVLIASLRCLVRCDYFGFGFRIVTRTKAFPPSLTCFRRCKHSPRALSQIHSTLSKLTLSKCSAVHVTAVTDFTCPRRCCRHSPLTTSHTRTPPLAAPLTTCRLLV